MALDRGPDRARQQTSPEKDGAAGQMIGNAEIRVVGSPGEVQRHRSEDKKLDRSDRPGESRKREIEPQGRENDEEKIEQRGPCPENDGGGEIAGEEIEQQRWETCLDQRRSYSARRPENSDRGGARREQAGREQLIGDEGGEGRERRAHREFGRDRSTSRSPGRKSTAQQDQDKNERLHDGQVEHTAPLADENFPIQEPLKRRVRRVRRLDHLHPSLAVGEAAKQSRRIHRLRARPPLPTKDVNRGEPLRRGQSGKEKGRPARPPFAVSADANAVSRNSTSRTRPDAAPSRSAWTSAILSSI